MADAFNNWGTSFNRRQNASELRAGRCALATVVSVMVLVVLACTINGWANASNETLHRAPETANKYHPFGPEPLETLRDTSDDETAGRLNIPTKMHGMLRRAMARACREDDAPPYIMASEYVLRRRSGDNSIVREFNLKFGCYCDFSECLFLEDPVVLKQNVVDTVTFACSDSIIDGEAPKQTIRELPYSVLMSDARQWSATTVLDACKVGLLVDVLQ